MKVHDIDRLTNAELPKVPLTVENLRPLAGILANIDRLKQRVDRQARLALEGTPVARNAHKDEGAYWLAVEESEVPGDDVVEFNELIASLRTAVSLLGKT